MTRAVPVADSAPHQPVIGVALPVPEPYGSLLQDWRRSFKDPMADAIPTHITLVPPTPVGADEMSTIEHHLKTAAAEIAPFRVRLRGTATFRPVSPVVFVAVAEGISNCEVLARRLRSGPLDVALTFPYHPHVTVAHDVPEPMLEQAFEALADFEAVFEADVFGLYLHGSDGVWRPKREFPLGRAR